MDHCCLICGMDHAATATGSSGIRSNRKWAKSPSTFFWPSGDFNGTLIGVQIKIENGKRIARFLRIRVHRLTIIFATFSPLMACANGFYKHMVHLAFHAFPFNQNANGQHQRTHRPSGRHVQQGIGQPPKSPSLHFPGGCRDDA